MSSAHLNYTTAKIPMRAVPTTITEANRIVARWHRHARPVVGALFAVGVAVRGDLVGVAIVGRPIARVLQDGKTCEVNRLCVVDGVSHLHVCSSLYGRCVRIARELGYQKIVTYTLEQEPGTSLRAAGFTVAARVEAKATWSVPSRKRCDSVVTLFGEEPKRNTGPKIRWERTL